MSDRFFFDRGLVDTGVEFRDRFVAARPFPHVCIDDFLPAEVADQLAARIPALDGAPFESSANPYEIEKYGRLETRAFDGLDPYVRSVLDEFNAMTMLDFLEALSGIDGLIADPHFNGGAIHQIRTGGRLAVHADFSRDDRRRLDRRLNVLLYLNPGWDDAWGGALELWSPDMSTCEVSLAPRHNRCVIFTTTLRSFHGHPEPLRCPEGVTRTSLAFYYYRNGREDDEHAVGFHPTLWQRRPNTDDVATSTQVGSPGFPDDSPVRPVAKALRRLRPLVPPAAVDLARRVRDRSFGSRRSG